MQNHLNAAKGWLDLGNHAEASRELDQIAGALRVHPDVLEVRWQICARMKMWTAALEISSAIIELAPERSFGYLHQAYSFHALGYTEKAYNALTQVAGKFPEVIAIPYCLACYACQLQRVDDAYQWFEQAVTIGDEKRIVQAALNEPMLQPIWDRLRKQRAVRKSVAWLPRRSRRTRAKELIRTQRGMRRF